MSSNRRIEKRRNAGLETRRRDRSSSSSSSPSSSSSDSSYDRRRRRRASTSDSDDDRSYRRRSRTSSEDRNKTKYEQHKRRYEKIKDDYREEHRKKENFNDDRHQRIPSTSQAENTLIHRRNAESSVTSSSDEKNENFGKITMKLSSSSNTSSFPTQASSATSRGSTPQQNTKTFVTPKIQPPVRKVASIFTEEDDDEPEEMPPEAKMRMKNVGRETPTSVGPNSYGKTKIGFCNPVYMAARETEERQLESSLLSKK